MRDEVILRAIVTSAASATVVGRVTLALPQEGGARYGGHRQTQVRGISAAIRLTSVLRAGKGNT